MAKSPITDKTVTKNLQGMSKEVSNLEKSVKDLESKLVLKTQQMQIMNEQHVNTVNQLNDQVKRLKQTIKIINKKNVQDELIAHHETSNLDKQTLIQRNKQLRDEIEKVHLENLRLKKAEEPHTKSPKTTLPIISSDKSQKLSREKEREKEYDTLSLSKEDDSGKRNERYKIKTPIQMNQPFGTSTSQTGKAYLRADPGSNESYKLTTKRSHYNTQNQFSRIEITHYPEERTEDSQQSSKIENLHHHSNKEHVLNPNESGYSRESGLEPGDFQISKSNFHSLNPSLRTVQREKKAELVINKITEYSNKMLQKSQERILKEGALEDKVTSNLPETEVIKQQTNQQLRDKLLKLEETSVIDFESRLHNNSNENERTEHLVHLKTMQFGDKLGVSCQIETMLISEATIYGERHENYNVPLNQEKYSKSSQKQLHSTTQNKKHRITNVNPESITCFRESSKEIPRDFDETRNNCHFEGLELIHENLISKIVSSLYTQFRKSLEESVKQQKPCTIAFEEKMEGLFNDEDPILTSLVENYKEYRIIFNETNYEDIEKEIEYQLQYDLELLKKEKPNSTTEFSSRVWSKNDMLYNATSALFDSSDHILVNLFRYLGLKHRSKNVFQGSAYLIAPKMEKMLGVAICENLVKYFQL